MLVLEGLPVKDQSPNRSRTQLIWTAFKDLPQR